MVRTILLSFNASVAQKSADVTVRAHLARRGLFVVLECNDACGVATTSGGVLASVSKKKAELGSFIKQSAL